ncbi:MAG TPA: DUF2975 domain-containing protein [Cyclobacteriaceae bacterium]|jgi:hypothetical protein|nr:DUF2975 domain-containing protein [Cyclobacteriaceae bacterium]
MNTDIKKTRTFQILTIMHILAWVAFVGFMIEAGAVLVSYCVSVVNPDAARNLYKGLDLYSLRQFNGWHYTGSVSFIIALSLMKAYVSFLVIKTLSKVNLMNPFTMEVSKKMEKISYVLFEIWIVSMLKNAHTGWLLKATGGLQGEWVNGDFILMAGLVFVLSQVFKRGVEIQSENELTV